MDTIAAHAEHDRAKCALKNTLQELKDKLVKTFKDFKVVKDANDVKEKIECLEKIARESLEDTERLRMEENIRICCAEVEPLAAHSCMSASEKTRVAAPFGSCVWTVIKQCSFRSKHADLLSKRQEACELLENASHQYGEKRLQTFKEAKQLLLQGKLRVCRENATPEEVRTALKEGNHLDKSLRQIQQHNAWDWADVLGVVGASVQLCVAWRTAIVATAARTEIMEQVAQGRTSDNVEVRAHARSWAASLARERDNLHELERDFQVFFETTIMELDTEHTNIEATPTGFIYARLQVFVNRGNASVNAVQTLAIDVKTKAAGVHAALFASQNSTLTSVVHTGVAGISAAFRFNPATALSALVWAISTGVSAYTVHVNKEALELLNDFDDHVKTTLLEANAFFVEMTNNSTFSLHADAEYAKKLEEAKSKGDAAVEAERKQRMVVEEQRMVALEEAQKQREHNLVLQRKIEQLEKASEPAEKLRSSRQRDAEEVHQEKVKMAQYDIWFEATSQKAKHNPELICVDVSGTHEMGPWVELHEKEPTSIHYVISGHRKDDKEHDVNAAFKGKVPLAGSGSVAMDGRSDERSSTDRDSSTSLDATSQCTRWISTCRKCGWTKHFNGTEPSNVTASVSAPGLPSMSIGRATEQG